jgi:pimeloyl-ACP methyl ester carboxylesterase
VKKFSIHRKTREEYKEKKLPHYIAQDGLKRYYEIHGEGETIVLLHHGFGCTKMWQDIYPALVAQGYRVLMYDRRGFGRSDKGEAFFKFYVSETFREAGVNELEHLRDALSLDSFHAVGQCEGGVVAVDYAAAHPARVKSLVTSSTQCFSPVSMPEFNREKFPKSFQELDDDLKAKLLDWHGEEHAGPFYEQFRDEGGSYGTGLFDLRPTLPEVRCPTLVLYPDRSVLFEVEQGVHFYRHLPQGELQVIPRCGHNTYEQRPGEYVSAILAFLKRVGKGRNDLASLMATCLATGPPAESDKKMKSQ